MMRVRKQIGVFLIAGAVTAGLVSSGAALAGFSRKHASDCMTFGGTPIDTNFNIGNNSTTSSMVLLCPTPDSSQMPQPTFAQARAYGFDGNNQAYVQGVNFNDPEVRNCSSTDNVGGACSPIASPALAVGAFDLNPGVGPRWDNIGGEFGYTHVRIPPRDGAAISYLRGIFVAD